MLHTFLENLAFKKKIHIDFRIDFFCIPLFPAYFIPCNIIFPSYKYCWTPSKLGICSIFFFFQRYTRCYSCLFFWYKSTLGYIQQPHTVQCVNVHGYARNSNVLLNVHWLEHNSASKLFATKSFRLNWIILLIKYPENGTILYYIQKPQHSHSVKRSFMFSNLT